MLRESTHLELHDEVQMDVFGKKFAVTLGCCGRHTAKSSAHDIEVFGYSRGHALSNLHFAVVCLAHIEAKRFIS